MKFQPSETKPPQLNPKKLLLSKWTAVHAVAKQKHFLVSQLIQPADPTLAPTEVEIEAVYSGQKQVIFWRELQDTSRWRQGWL